MASSLPTEVLIAICEQVGSTTANELPRDARGKHAAVGSQLGVFKPCVLDLRAFSGASRRFREVATPLLFRNVCVRTREQVVGLVRSKLLVHVCHVHFPAINILTCRRPLGSHIATLIQQAQSLRVASSEPAFYTDLNRHLGSLLRSTQHLLGLEVYGEAHVPHVDAMAVLADFISVIPKTVQTLTMSLPGGRPSFAGIETFFARISPDDVIDPPLPSLKHLYVSLQLPLQIALAPSELALPLARRLPKLDLIAIAAPKRGAQPGMPPWDLGGPGGHAAGWGMSGGHVKIWRVRRRLDGSAGLGDTGDWEQAPSILQVGDFVDTYL